MSRASNRGLIMTTARKSLAEEVFECKRLADEVKARRNGTDGAALTARTPSPQSVFGAETAPRARNGEDPLSSRGYSYVRLIKALNGHDSLKHPGEYAKVEFDMAKKFARLYGSGPGTVTPKSMMAPFSSALLTEGDDEPSSDLQSLRRECKALVIAGTAQADLDEMSWLRGKMYEKAYGTKAPQSWLDITLVGALVGPPAFGEFIDLYRNEAALTRAASPAAEALARMDMAKTLALTFDKAALEGPGTDVQPLGILNTPGVNVVTPTTVAANGNTLAVQDVYSFPAAVEENNGRFEAFIMRPQLYWAMLQRRVDAAVASDKSGVFAFSPYRALDEKLDLKAINGYPVSSTPQVSNTRVKGSGTNLTYMIGAQFSDFVEAFFGAMEFAAATQGDTLFPSDQTAVRGILIGDCGCRHPGVYAWADQLING
jgi:hypothetical protein